MRFDHIAYQVPDIAEAVGWVERRIPNSEVRYHDESWALVRIEGLQIAFVRTGEHPNHVAMRVEPDELEQIAQDEGIPISTHRDASRGIYLAGPGELTLEFITYPEDQ